MPQSLATFDSALKDDYGPGLREATNNSNPVFTETGTNTEDIVGRQAVWSVHIGRSSSSSARAEGSPLASADRQRYVQARDDLAYVYHTIKVTGPAKHLTQNDRGSFARALETEIKGAEKDLKNDMAREVFGQNVTLNSVSYNGVIGLATNVSGAVITLGNISASEMRYFWVNQDIEVIDGTLATSRGHSTVSAKSVANKTITLTAIPAGTATSDAIVRYGNLGNEINGLRFLIASTGAYAGIDPATYPDWAAQAVGSSTTGVSEVFFDQLSESVETDGDGSTPSLFIAEQTQRRKLASQMQAQKRYDGKSRTLTAGWKGLDLDYGTLVADRFCPVTSVFAITPDELVRFIGLDFTWDEDDGKVLYKALDNSDAVEARFKAYINMEATTRNAHAVGTLVAPTF